MFNNIDYDSLSVIDRSIINYIVHNPEISSLMRVRELADATHVSPSTIIRFVKRVGYDSFTELKLDIHKNLVRDASVITSNLSQLSYKEPLVFESNFEEKIDKLVTRIAQAEVTFCVGIGSSGIMAEYFSRLLNSLGHLSLFYQDAGLPYFLGKDYSRETSNLIFFSTSGETRELVTTAQTIEPPLTYTISITNNSMNALAAETDLNIAYYVTLDRFIYNVDFTSQIPVVYIIETVIRKLHELANKKDILSKQ